MKSTETIENCTVEFQRERGVLYVHAPGGYTVVRIQGLGDREALFGPDKLPALIDVDAGRRART